MAPVVIRASRQAEHVREDDERDGDRMAGAGVRHPYRGRDDVVTTGDAIVTGLGKVDGRPVAIIAIDPTVLAGTTAPVDMRKQNRSRERIVGR
jgi:acetyl-CoA carboxylase carboxyltransferase component